MTISNRSRPVPRRNAVTRLVSAASAAHYARSSPTDVAPEEITSIAGERQPLTEGVDVTTDISGRPVRIQWRGRSYTVLKDPLRWFARRRWWLEAHRAERGRPGLVAEEIWRVQLEDEQNTRPLLGSSQYGMPCTVDLGKSRSSGQWRILRFHELPAPPEAVE